MTQQPERKPAIIKQSGDFSHLALADRLNQGRDIGEKFIISALAKQGVKIIPSLSPAKDKYQKIDGYLNGKIDEPVQIKLRKTTLDNRNDIAYELIQNHDPQLPVMDQLRKSPGRDYRGRTIKHYFVLSQNSTEIYYVPAERLKEAVHQAMYELESSKGGVLMAPFTAANGVNLRPTRDNDPKSYTPTKVMAFIPVSAVVEKTYPVTLTTPAAPGPATGGMTVPVKGS